MFDISPRTVLFQMTFQIACIESGKIILVAFIWLVSGMYELSNVTLNHSDQSRYVTLVTPCPVTCENVGIVVITRDEKTAPPLSAQLQMGHTVICISSEKLDFSQIVANVLVWNYHHRRLRTSAANQIEPTPSTVTFRAAHIWILEYLNIRIFEY